MKELQELRNEILTLRNYGVINKEEELSLLSKLNSLKEQLTLTDVSQQRELLKVLEYSRQIKNNPKDIQLLIDKLYVENL